MVNILFLIALVFTINSQALLAKDTNSKIDSNNCFNGLFNKEIEDLKVKKIEIQILNKKKWQKNLLNLNLYLEDKKNKSAQSWWIDNFRISDEYKKKFESYIIVNYTNNIKCKYKSEIRVTGDMWWHLDWKNGQPFSSIFIKLLEGNIYNSTKFKLFLPKSREEDNEVFIANFLKHLGFISPKTFFTNVEINGVESSFIFQEDIQKEMLESLNFREGPILEGDERFSIKLTDDELNNFPPSNVSRVINRNFFLKNIENTIVSLEAISNLNKVYLSNHIYRNKNQIIVNDLYTDSLFLLGDFLSKENIELLNTYESLSYAIDIVHGLSLDDRRFYYDAFRKFYYPIYYDGKSNILEKTQFTSLDVMKKKYSNASILGAESALKLVDKVNIIKFLEDLKISGINLSEIEVQNKLDLIKLRLNTLKTLEQNTHYSEDLNSFFNLNVKNNNLINFVFSNINKKQFSICNYNLKECENINLSEDSFYEILNEVINQNFNKLDKLTDKKNKTFLYENSFENIDKSNFLDEFKYLDGFRDSKIFYKNSEIIIDRSNKKIEIIQLNELGKVIFVGGSLDNWTIDFKGKKKKNNIYLENNHLNNFTGCLTFYETNFNLINISSKNSNCEDSINIIRSTGNINKVIINYSMSDGLDVDFSNLSFENIIISNSVNDCIDVSSGVYNIKNLEVAYCGDKGFSVGEKSFVTIRNIKVNNSDVGIASKDSSLTDINQANIIDSKTCLSAYNKKQEFNGGEINIKKLNCDKFNQKMYHDKYSKISFTN